MHIEELENKEKEREAEKDKANTELNSLKKSMIEKHKTELSNTMSLN